MRSGIRRSGAQPRDAQAIAENALRSWERVRSWLAPVIGEDGFRILFARALHLTRYEFPWLAREAKLTGKPFAELKGSLESQTLESAEEASRRLLAAFTELLNGLIGETLATRLLNPPLDADKASEPSN